MRLKNKAYTFLLATIGSLAGITTSTQAGEVSINATAPTVDAMDESNYAAPTGAQKWFNDIERDAGQTFTPTTDGLLESFTIYLSSGNPNDGGSESVDLRFGTISRPEGVFTFTDVYSEAIDMAPSPEGDWLADDYITFTFDTPQPVTAGVEYGIITEALSMGSWQQGIPYRHRSGNTYAGGVLINRGSESTNSDLIFHANIITDGVDMTPPAISSQVPANDSSNAAAESNLIITFDEDVQKGATGNITIKNSDNSDFEVIPIGDARITVSGDAVTIDPAGTLVNEASYYVLIDSGAIADTAGTPNDFAGIADPATWNFGVAAVDMTGPGIASTSPADNAIGVALEDLLVITFDEMVQDGTGTITITETGLGVFETIPVPDPRVSISGAVVTITPDSFFNYATDYHVEITSGAVTDLANNDFAGVTGTDAWNFTTTSEPVDGDIIISTTPPGVNGADIANLTTPTGSQKWFNDIEHDAGQTFTPNEDGFVKSFTIYLAKENPNDNGSENVDLRFGTISRPDGVFTFTDVYSENTVMAPSPEGDWEAGDYITFTFTTPQAVSVGVEYGIITDAQSMGSWQQGIPYRHTTGDVYAGGVLINRGGESPGSDLVFHVDIEPATGGGGGDIVIADVRHLGATVELDLAELDSSATYKLFRDSTLPLSGAKVQVGADITGTTATTVTDTGPLPPDGFYQLEKQP